MRDLRLVARDLLFFLLAVPVVVFGVTFSATLLWGGLLMVADNLLVPLFTDSDPYAWILRVGAAEVLSYGAWRVWRVRHRTSFRRPHPQPFPSRRPHPQPVARHLAAR